MRKGLKKKKKKNSIQRLYKCSFNPKDFWEKAVEGRAHTNTSLYIKIYIVGNMMEGLLMHSAPPLQ